MIFGILLLGAMLLALLLTGALRRYALAKSLMDIPNARSSHSVPTPRGGGVAIIVAFLICMLAYPYLQGESYGDESVALVGAGLLVAIVGFLDDHGHIAARWRLLSHFIAASWALYWLGGLPPLTLFGSEFDLGAVGAVLAAVYLVWLLNLYNFMDGIDGIASIEAVTVCVGGVVSYLLSQPEGGSALSDLSAPIVLPMLLASAVIGFFIWNFPPARIFMGDAGSGFVGLSLGVLSVAAAWQVPALMWCWVILLGVFIVDATYTLMRRLARGDKVYEAHRSHAYQYASRYYGAHKPITLTVGLINLTWLLPMAALVAIGALDGVIAVLIAYAPLVLLAVRFNAGKLEFKAE